METAEEHSRRRQKRSNGEKNLLSIDRISDLPDSVLCHILSFLGTKDSVRTSILGKRWRYLWAYVPNLVFRNENQDAINRVLLLRKVQNINTFRLADWVDCNKNQIDTWMNFAVERNLQNLDFSCHKFDIALPRCIFTCKTLVDLRLKISGVIPNIGGGVVCLPRLKKLCLIHNRYEGDESLPHFLSGCPVLEELLIHLFINHYPCKISSPTIKRLVLNLHVDGASDNQDYCDRLEINTPALVSLQLFDGATQYIKCGELNALTEAHISICNSISPQDDFLYSRSVVEFIDRLHNVKYLKLDLSYCTKIIDSVFSTWKSISFHNLTKLELTTDCCFLSKLLESADNLEILILSQVHGETRGWMEPQQVSTCLLSHLRTIKLTRLVGKEHMFKIMRYLLRNAQVLERMEIVYPRIIGSKEKIYMLEEISLLERASKACKVAFVSN